jgi:HEAT repeat protein
MDNTLLARAQTAAQNHQWEQVSNYLLELDPTADAPQILALSLQVLTQGDFQDSWQVAKVLPKLSEIAVLPLIDLLNDAELSAETHWFVGRILGTFSGSQVIVALTDSLHRQPNEALTSIIIQTMTALGEPAIQQLTELLLVPAQKMAAVFALAQIRHSHGIEPLLTVVDDPSDQIRSIAIEALGSFHDQRIPPLLIAKLSDPATTVRLAAVNGLGMRPELATALQLVDRLQPLLSDVNSAVYLAGAIALGRMGSEEAVQALGHCYQQSACPADLQVQIIGALGWIDSTQSLDYLGQILATDSAERGVLAVRSMGWQQSQQPQIIAILREYLQQLPTTATSATRQEIAMVLGNLSTSEAVELLKMLLADPDERVRWQASYYLQQRRGH